jgi:hypothetical protein
MSILLQPTKISMVSYVQRDGLMEANGERARESRITPEKMSSPAFSRVHTHISLRERLSRAGSMPGKKRRRNRRRP